MNAKFSILLRAASRLNARARAKALVRPAHTLPPLFFLTDPARTPNALAMLQSLPSSADGKLGVIYRHFGVENRVETAKTLASLCRKRRFLLLIAADPALAARVGANGVHLPERLGRQAKRLKKKRPNWLITGAAHSRQALKQSHGCDAFFVSPAFDTQSLGAMGRKRLGAAGLKRLSGCSAQPVYALGGVNAGTIKQLRALPNLWGAGISTGLTTNAVWIRTGTPSRT